ncbi:metallophosphoesterase, partial [Helicobacter rodentium]
MKSFFPLLALMVFLIFHLSIYFFFIRQIIQPKIPRLVLKYFLIFNFFGVIAYFAARYFVDFPQSLYFLVSLSIGVGFVLFVVMLVYQTLKLVLWLLFWLFPSFSKERRGFFQRVLNLSSGIFALGYLGVGLVEGRLQPKIERVKIPLKNLKNSMNAVQISDLHIGGLIEENVVRQIVQQINALKPDFIVLTGDIVDTEITKVSRAIAELAKLNAPLGVYFIAGNHEYFHSIQPLFEGLKSIGIRVLENECVQLVKNQGTNEEAIVNLAGVYDLFGRRIG